MSPGRPAATVAAAGCALLLCVAASTGLAQLPHLDPLPWFSPADSTSRLALVVQVDRGVDGQTEWSTNRVMLTALLPAGARGAWFLRMPYLSFDTAGLPVRVRWPGTTGTEQPPGWPGGERLEGFGQIEVGGTGPLGLPGLGPWHFGLALGLPTGQNGLYPWSSTSLPLRLQLRRDLRPDGPWHLWLGGGYLLHLDAGGDKLDGSAFPNGWQVAGELELVRRRGSSWHLTGAWEDRNTRRSLLVGAEVWLPWTANGSLGLRAARELAAAEHRPAQWWLSLAWRFDSPQQPPQESPAAK